MIWPFKRSQSNESDREDESLNPPGAAPGRGNSAPEVLFGEPWDPMQTVSRSASDPEPTYGRPGGDRRTRAGPRPGTPGGAAPPVAPAKPDLARRAPGWRSQPERPGDATAGGVVLPGGALAGGVRPPGPGADATEREAFLHAVRALHRVDEAGTLAGAGLSGFGRPPPLVRPQPQPLAQPTSPLPRTQGAAPERSAPTAQPAKMDPGWLAPRDVAVEGLPRERISGRWYQLGTPVVMARGLVAAAGNRTLSAVDLTLSAGERWGVLGANGAGKTTLLRTLAGLHEPVSGVLEWGGVGATKLNAQQWARHCAFLPTAIPEPFDETVRQRVARIGSPELRVDAAITAMGLNELADRRWSSLSSGERQRAWVAFTLASDADALILDEPLAHQDPRERLRLADAFAAEAGQGRLLMVTAHDPDWVLGHCTHAIVIGTDGSIAQGPVDRVLQPAVLAAAYAVPWRRVLIDGRPALVAGR